MKRQGFTLVEVLMTALITTLIGGALLVVAIAGRRVSDLTNARLTAQTEAQRGLNRLTEDLRMASTSTLNGEKGIECLVAPNTNSDPLQLQFKRVLPDGLLSGEIIYWRQTKTSGGGKKGQPTVRNQLMRQPPSGGSDQVVATGVTVFDFSSVCNDAANTSGMAQVRLTAQANSWQGPMTQTVESQVWIRNPKPPSS